MIRFLMRLTGLAVLLCAPASIAHAEDVQTKGARWSIAIHGGAGTIERGVITPEQDG